MLDQQMKHRIWERTRQDRIDELQYRLSVFTGTAKEHEERGQTDLIYAQFLLTAQCNEAHMLSCIAALESMENPYA